MTMLAEAAGGGPVGRSVAERSWVAERRWRHIVIGIALVAVGAQWIRILVQPVGDFGNHWLWGARFLRGEFLYTGGANLPYLPVWAMAHAPLTLIPVQVAQALLYPLGVLSLLALAAALHALTRRHLPIAPRRIFWAGATAVFLASRYIERDLAEWGPNTFLLALAWIAILAWSRGRWAAGALLLGAAVALKLTALLYVAYFALRRQFRFALASAGVAVVLALMPVVWQGPALYGRHVATWAAAVRDGVVSPDPRMGMLGLEKINNLSLRPALARYLMHIPEGPADHGRFRHRWNVDVLTLPAASAVLVTRAGIIALVALVAWTLRRGAGRLDTILVWDSAAVAILALLVSPITWQQHCVAILPACYLIVRLRLGGTALPSIASAAVAALLVFSIGLGRSFAGRTVESLVYAYYLHTMTLLLLLAAVIVCRSRILADVR